MGRFFIHYKYKMQGRRVITNAMEILRVAPSESKLRFACGEGRTSGLAWMDNKATHRRSVRENKEGAVVQWSLEKEDTKTIFKKYMKTGARITILLGVVHGTSY